MTTQRASDDDLTDIADRQANSGPQPGEFYRHCKGGIYEIVTRAVREDTHEDVVIYRKFVKGENHRLRWERTAADFMATVEIDGKTGLRFIREPGASTS